MRCVSGKHEWVDKVSAERCCSPNWTRILLLPGESLKRAMEEDPTLDIKGYNVARDDGFQFVWKRIGDDHGKDTVTV
jgi:hypothetical protein